MVSTYLITLEGRIKVRQRTFTQVFRLTVVCASTEVVPYSGHGGDNEIVLLFNNLQTHIALFLAVIKLKVFYNGSHI